MEDAFAALRGPKGAGARFAAQLNPQGGNSGLDAVATAHPPADASFGQGQIGQGFEGGGVCHCCQAVLSMTDLTTMSTIGGLCAHGSFQCLHPTQILDQNKQM